MSARSGFLVWTARPVTDPNGVQDSLVLQAISQVWRGPCSAFTGLPERRNGETRADQPRFPAQFFVSFCEVEVCVGILHFLVGSDGEEFTRNILRIAIIAALRSDRRHRCVGQSTGDGEQIIAAGQVHARLKREVVHRSQYATIGRTTEGDGSHGSYLPCNGLLRHTEGVEQRSDGCTQIRHESGSQRPGLQQHREKRTFIRRDHKLWATEANEMDVPIAEPAR
jgi:hypothetical protein